MLVFAVWICLYLDGKWNTNNNSHIEESGRQTRTTSSMLHKDEQLCPQGHTLSSPEHVKEHSYLVLPLKSTGQGFLCFGRISYRLFTQLPEYRCFLLPHSSWGPVWVGEIATRRGFCAVDVAAQCRLAQQQCSYDCFPPTM